MADFQGTLALTSFCPAFGGHPGSINFTFTLSAAAYGGGNLNISGISQFLTNVAPADIQEISFEVGSTAAYSPVWTKATAPTFANLGTLELYTTTSAEASGTLTLTVRCQAVVFRQNVERIS